MSKRGNIYGTSDTGKQKKSAHRIHLTGVYIRIRNFAVLRLRLALYLLANFIPAKQRPKRSVDQILRSLLRWNPDAPSACCSGFDLPQIKQTIIQGAAGIFRQPLV